MNKPDWDDGKRNNNLKLAISNTKKLDELKKISRKILSANEFIILFTENDN
jgi:hypothetical protein